MKVLKTVKYFVSGSYKFFDIIECTVEDVDKITNSKGKDMISLTIDDKEYTGLFNKKVYEFLCLNENFKTFVVMWRSMKGDYMIAYSWNIWEDYINNECSENETKEEPPKENGESFVYLWLDIKEKKSYIGKHKGNLEDGYICSSDTMMEAYKERQDDFVRAILAWGDDSEMTALETILLLQLKASKSKLYYNLSDNLRS